MKNVKRLAASAAAVLTVVLSGDALGAGLGKPQREGPHYLVRMEFAADSSGVGGKIQKTTFFEIPANARNEKDFRVLDPNERLRSGRNIEYRVVNINPFRFNAKGENSTTAFKNEFSEGALALLNGKESNTPQKPKDDGQGGKAPDTKKPTVGPPEVIKGATTVDPNLLNANPDLPAAKPKFDPVKFADEHFDLSTLVGISAVELPARLKKARVDAEKMIEEAAPYRSIWPKASDVLTKRYFDYVSKIDEIGKGIRIAGLDKPVVPNLDFTDQLKKAQFSASRVAEIGSLGATMVAISRIEIDGRSSTEREKGGAEAKTAAIIENMRDRATSELKSVLMSDDVTQIGVQLNASKDSFVEVNRDLVTNVDKASKELGDDSKIFDDKLSSLGKEEADLQKEREVIVDQIIAEPGPIMLNSAFDLAKILRAVNTRLELNSIQSSQEVNAAAQSSYKQARKRIQGLIDYAKTVKESIDKLKKDFDIALPEAKKGADRAAARYGAILTTKFEITAFSKVTEEGQVNFKLSLFTRAEDDSEKQIGEDYKLAFEVYSPTTIRVVETSVAYVFSGLRKADYYLHTEQNSAPPPDTLQVVRRRPQDQFGTNLALFLTVPFSQKATSPLGASFGYNPTDQSYYFGLSYLHGRSQGVTLTFGAVLGKTDVLDHQRVNKPLPNGDTEVRTRSVSQTSAFLAIGFRIKT